MQNPVIKLIFFGLSTKKLFSSLKSAKTLLLPNDSLVITCQPIEFPKKQKVSQVLFAKFGQFWVSNVFGTGES